MGTFGIHAHQAKRSAQVPSCPLATRADTACISSLSQTSSLKFCFFFKKLTSSSSIAEIYKATTLTDYLLNKMEACFGLNTAEHFAAFSWDLLKIRKI